MKPAIGEFLSAAAARLDEGLPLREQLTLEIYLDLLEKKLVELVEEHRLRDTRETPLLHQLENVLLRYDSPEHWRNFLDGIRIRKRWWNEEKKEWTSSAPNCIRKLRGWLPETDGIDSWSDDNPAIQCLLEACQSMKEMYYPEEDDEPPSFFPDNWDAFALQLSEVLRIAVLRELFLRLVGRALNE